jgi:peptidoglycan/xylan/chitin deacetylase (PgdA/CDA1 family)
LSLAGYALWRLGSEDPTTWYALPVAGKLSRKPEQFEHVPMAQDIFLTGSGDFLRVTSAPVDGVRVVEPDPTAPLGQLVERYQTVPVPVTVNRYGAVPGAVALTFDDGPDRRWTPEILDILAKAGVKATFFVTGENAAFAPDLVQRMIAEGHELGNHTFTHPNMGTASDIVSVLEINGTQRLIEATSGRKMRMFRAPYVGDSEPATLDEVRPLLLAQERGLYVVGLRADSHDWKHVAVNDIVASVMREVGTLDHQKSQTILFHDAGGDRSATVAALPVVIEALRARGFQIVPASFFAGETQASIMPEVPKWTFSRLIASLFFTALRLLAQIATFLFFGAIGLGLARLVLICWLAIMQGRKKHATAAPPSGDSLVSVLIPAFNEQKVINGCIDRLLKSSYRNIEVLVIDDGSTDKTAECAARVAAQDQRLRVFTIANGGKANALNFGLRHSHGETVIALDADTQFQSETVARLVRWFENPSVVAVAGNAKVGNRVNFLTRCQALEYITRKIWSVELTLRLAASPLFPALSEHGVAVVCLVPAAFPTIRWPRIKILPLLYNAKVARFCTMQQQLRKPRHLTLCVA